MSLDYYIQSGGKLLRCGYTTGSCAAMAAYCSAQRLLSGKFPESVSLLTPKGIEVSAEPEECVMHEDGASCCIQKDGGDDIDATHGLLIGAKVALTEEPGIIIDGGEGVGRVTKPGLDQPVGSAAINSVPRKMIESAVQKALEQNHFPGGAKVTVFVPLGKETAERTYNPHIGIFGGISILGTSGIVEPMSMQALIDTIKVELRQASAEGNKRIILTPGNYGEDFMEAAGYFQNGVPVVKISNFVGDALDEAAVLGFKEILLVGHIGKFCKLAGGIFNTHSRFADCRAEIFCAYAAICGAKTETCEMLMETATTDACLDILEEAGLSGPVLKKMLEAVESRLRRRVPRECKIGAVIFSNKYGELGKTASAKEILKEWG